MLHIKILLAGLHQEVNTFGPGTTTLDDYKRKQYLLGEDMFTFAKNHVRCNEGADGIAGCYLTLADAGAEVISGGFISAQPGSIIEQSVVDDYIAHLKAVTKANMPYDGVVLFMHGAAQSIGSDDPEGDIIEAVREIVGEDTPITVGLDLHANVTRRMVELSNTISLYQRYPHVDIWETGERAARLCLDIIAGKCHPKMAYVQIPMIVAASSYSTEAEPFKSLMAKGHAYVAEGKIYDFSVSQMQPWLDVADGYSSVIAVGEDADEAARIATEMAAELYGMRHQFVTELTDVDDIIRIAEKNTSGKVVVLNDFADSSNAGSAGYFDGEEKKPYEDFPQQKIYDTFVRKYDHKDDAFENVENAEPTYYLVTYKIMENDGMFRDNVESDAEMVQLFGILTYADGTSEIYLLLDLPDYSLS